MTILDPTDRRLLDFLKHDGRMSITELAARLGLSRVTVSSRIERLQSQRIIQRFTVQVSAAGDEGLVRAITTIEIQGLKSELVQRHLRQMPEIVTLHTTNGKWGLVAFSETRTLAEFDDMLTAIGRIPGVMSAETCLLLDQVL